MSPPAVPRSMRRAVFVSDVHLGSKHCHAAEFADFLAGLQCRRLYLVGELRRKAVLGTQMDVGNEDRAPHRAWHGRRTHATVSVGRHASPR